MNITLRDAGRWLLVLFLVGALVVGKLASIIFTLYFLAGLWLIARRSAVIGTSAKSIGLAFSAYFLVGLVAFAAGRHTELGEHLVGRDARFLAAGAVAVVAWAVALPRAWLRTALAVAGLVAGGVAVIQVLSADVRASGHTISILFGHLAAALAVANLALALFSRGWLRNGVIGAVAASVAVVLSETRGALLAESVAVLILLLSWCDGKSRRWAGVLTLLGLFGAVVVLTPLGSGLRQRTVDGVTEWQTFIAVQQELGQEVPGGALGCLNDPAFLDWFIDSRLLRTSRAARLEVISDSAVRTAGCADQAAIRITNPGRRRVFLVLPERSAPPGSLSGALLVRGTGRIALLGDTSDGITFSENEFALRSPPESGLRAQHEVTVPAHAFVDLVPVVSTPGEYRFPRAMDSVPARIHLWQAALAGAAQHPILGSGTGSFPALLKERAEQGQGPWQLLEFDHAHNEFLTVAAERGMAGVLALVFVYGVPLLVFARRRDDVGKTGLAVVATFFLSGLTETIFNHSLGITYYCTLIIILAAVPAAPAGAVPVSRDH